jgi:hypothetical protein
MVNVQVFQDPDEMGLETAVLIRDRSGWDIFGGLFWHFSGFLGIRKYCFLLLILRLGSTMMCCDKATLSYISP